MADFSLKNSAINLRHVVAGVDMCKFRYMYVMLFYVYTPTQW